MASTAYYQWVDAGKPYTRAKPTEQTRDVVRSHGFTVYDYPNLAHQTAEPPEDHTAYSATGWPIASKRWVGHAIDIMPGGDVALPALARQIIADKDAGLAGTKWIKYINWTDEDGNCWHTSWEPTKNTVRSTDKGHIHISARSDIDTSTEVADSGWDPVARALGEDDVTADDYLKILQDPRIKAYFVAVAWQYTGGGTPGGESSMLMAFGQVYDDLQAVAPKLDALLAAVQDVNTPEATLPDALVQEIHDIKARVQAVPTAVDNAAASLAQLRSAIAQ